jgi:F-type H+-transporting ATPase subunit b
LFQPYLSYLDEYEKKQAKIEKDYKNIDTLVAEAEAKKEKILKKARKKSDEIISESESLGAAKRTAIIEKAEHDAKALIDVSKTDIEKQRLSMLGGVKSQLVDLILKFNGKLFGEEKVSREYIEKKIDLIK